MCPFSSPIRGVHPLQPSLLCRPQSCIMEPLSHVATILLCCMPQMQISIVTTGLRHGVSLNLLQDDTSRQMCTCSCAGGFRQQGAAAECAKGPALGGRGPWAHRLLLYSVAALRIHRGVQARCGACCVALFAGLCQPCRLASCCFRILCLLIYASGFTTCLCSMRHWSL